MGKGGISKGKKAPSVHSRSARRATSPGIDTDKSLKNVRPPPESINQRPAVLAAHHGSGVTKKTKRKVTPSSKARRRQEKGIDRAEAVMERTAKKIQKSKGQARKIQARRKTWDEINEVIASEIISKKSVAPAAAIATALPLGSPGAVDSLPLDADQKMEPIDEEPRATVATVPEPTNSQAPAMAQGDDEDEIL
ncbi:hypothetical protein VTK73DRAFT_2283 [Phialemonium thermophilum]|uniref:Alb1-domain-containing protein n=1 Tax=Phialemonium thermophilum TaxID=223376 RepID=A0ABR3X5S5_9PEZI